MAFERWFLVVGVLLILMLVIERRLQALPLTSSMLYLGLGWLFANLGWIQFDPQSSAQVLEHLSEIAVIISLFCAGLKLRLPLRSALWRLPVALAVVSMTISVALIACVGMWWLGLPLGGAILLGAVLAPTDPVLASDVQVEHARDTDRVRFTLTGEAGFNDGTAFPFVMLGLAFVGLHEIGPWGWKWLAIDVAWAIGGALAVGALVGLSVGRLIIYLRQTREETVDLDDFLAIGVIALAYGLAMLFHCYGFLAVFAAGLSLRAVERELSSDDAPADVLAVSGTPTEVATHSEHAPAYMAQAVLQFTQQLERIGELTLVLLVGAILATISIPISALATAAIVILVIRPLAVAPVAYAAGLSGAQTSLVSWLGIRGIGSVYYLFYAVGQGLPNPITETLIQVTVTTIGVSVFAHGMTVTPLMRLYRKGSTGSRLMTSAPD